MFARPMYANPVAASTTWLPQAFALMFGGLLVSALTASLAYVPQVAGLIAAAIIPLLIVELGLVLVLSWALPKLGHSTAYALFVAYCAVTGVTLGLVTTLYTGESVINAFVAAAAAFGAAAAYGHLTQRDLNTIGGYAFMALVGLIVAMLVNLLLGSTLLATVISAGAVLIFVVLTAWDVQKIQSGKFVELFGDERKAAIYGALLLYLDFVNLFLHLLRLMGRRK